MVRTRWAAIGAVIAITLGAGGVGLVEATKGTGDRTVFTSVASCRLVDTRPANGIGGRVTPLGPTDTHTVSARGTSGECSDIPVDVRAVALNITALGASEPTHLTVWPGGDVPNASSLNPSPGQPPVPNAVTTPLSVDGTFDVFNFAGSVHVVIDLVGYHQDHHHDDRYHTKTEVDGLLADKVDAGDVYARSDVDQRLAAKADSDSVWTKGQADGRYANRQVVERTLPYAIRSSSFGGSQLSTNDRTVLSLSYELPQGGQLVVGYSGIVYGNPGDRTNCSVGTSTSFSWASGTSEVDFGDGVGTATISGTRVIDFFSASQGAVRLMCKNSDATASIGNIELNALVLPN